MTRAALALRLAELVLRLVPPLVRAAKGRDVDVGDVEARRAWIRREIERAKADRSKARLLGSRK